ncbi:hypothetical protein [Variovorax saccharolyticus]|uniref:hypothetical protein n=1 Tax=Variovorax saccharolyticus TaxID=3053516 RepID=UPI002577C0A0|nr:hypothetical protein [Variovorax sp. J31P216]MDM0029829.1 hypothetical protein [Variovorax sp. J31P216]
MHTKPTPPIPRVRAHVGGERLSEETKKASESVLSKFCGVLRKASVLLLTFATFAALLPLLAAAVVISIPLRIVRCVVSEFTGRPEKIFFRKALSTVGAVPMSCATMVYHALAGDSKRKLSDLTPSAWAPAVAHRYF